MYNHLLDTFILVADEKSINKASEKLFISPVSVMKQIRKLEEEFGIKLFDTSIKGCVLTKQGEEFYKGAKEVIDYSNNVTNKIKQIECSTLKLGISFFNSGSIFFDKWNQIEEMNHDLKINLVPIEENKLSLKNLNNGNVDLLIGLCDSYKKPKCEIMQIGTCKHIVVVPKKHRLAKHKIIKLSDLKNVKIYIPKKGLFSSFDELVDMVIDNTDTVEFIEMKSEANVSKIMSDSINNNALFFATDSLDNKHPGLVTIPLEFGEDVPYCLFYTRKLLREHPQVRRMLYALKQMS